MERKPLTRDEIHRIVGELDDERAAAIVATGADAAQLEEARLWAQGESDAMGEERKSLSGPVAAVYEILIANREFADNER